MDIRSFNILGLMSGTSMDGIDISIVQSNGIILKTKKNFYYEYKNDERAKLKKILLNRDKLSIPKIKHRYDILISKIYTNVLLDFKNFNLYDYIGFHGQTIYHDPKNKTSIQLGNPKIIAEKLKKNIIYEFRKADLINGGQGAPIAPIYHKYLIQKFKFKLPCCFVNIGGISNISYWDGKTLLGFDIGPGNVFLDDFVKIFYNKSYDVDGEIASRGHYIQEIIESFFQDSFFRIPPPKSLDRNHFANFFKNLIKRNFKKEDILLRLLKYLLSQY